MQVTCQAFDWEEVKKRPDVETVVAEMIRTDDVDIYSTYLPNETWPSDSAILHFSVASALAELLASSDAERYPGVRLVARLISDGDSVDELGLSPLTEGTYFVSLSPDRVVELSAAFAQLPIDAVAERCAEAAQFPAAAVAQWLTQWRDALAFAQSRGLGLLGHCG